jgi:hypothetical protein
VEPLRKGSPEAAAVAAMLAEEGLDPQTAAAVMAFLYKEKRAPGVVVIRGRIQRFKGGWRRCSSGNRCLVLVAV